jgi:hypothetical protein
MYQTPADLAAENIVVTLLAKQRGGVFQKLPIAYHLDYAYYECDGSALTAWYEVKNRSGSYTSQRLETLGGYMLSLHKWFTAYQYALLTRCPFILAVHLMDGLFVVSFTAEEMLKAPVRFRLGGRRDRDDWQDTEVCVFIPMGLFERQSGG